MLLNYSLVTLVIFIRYDCGISIIQFIYPKYSMPKLDWTVEDSE